jgi:hypothetical protein
LAKVEHVAVNVVGRYVHGEHDVCIVMVLNMGHLNQVFEQAGVPYGPRLEPGSKASKVAAKKRKDDAGAGLAGKHAKVPGRKVMALNVSTVPRELRYRLVENGFSEGCSCSSRKVCAES